MNGASRTIGNLLLAFAAIFAAALLPGCRSQHPDDKAQVYQVMSQHDLASVEVSQDRSKGVITLRGVVGSPDLKTRAEQLAQQAAPGYTIQNQLTVDQTGIMSMANPNAKAPEVEQMAHPPTGDNSTPSPKPKRHPRK
jgi:hypothetical protein